MAIEIERKWVAESAPDGLGQHLRQGYLAVDGDVTVRLRITDAAAMLTVKAGAGMARTEVEVELDQADADSLWAHTDGRIDKERCRLSLDGGLVAEIDRYHGDLNGLITVEVEFASEEEAAAFEAPAWFGREVTGDHRWSNASLSRHGRPDAGSGE